MANPFQASVEDERSPTPNPNLFTNVGNTTNVGTSAPTDPPPAPPANPPPAMPAAADATPVSLGITFRDQSGFELAFKLKHKTVLSKAMDAFSARAEKERKSLRFLFEGERVLDGHTPESFQMQDGDVVDVHTEQIGGGDEEV